MKKWIVNYVKGFFFFFFFWGGNVLLFWRRSTWYMQHNLATCNYHIPKNDGKGKERKGGQEGGRSRSVLKGQEGSYNVKGERGEGA